MALVPTAFTVALIWMKLKQELVRSGTRMVNTSPTLAVPGTVGTRAADAVVAFIIARAPALTDRRRGRITICSVARICDSAAWCLAMRSARAFSRGSRRLGVSDAGSSEATNARDPTPEATAPDAATPVNWTGVRLEPDSEMDCTPIR